jgi:hypothetical protein
MTCRERLRQQAHGRPLGRNFGPKSHFPRVTGLSHVEKRVLAHHGRALLPRDSRQLPGMPLLHPLFPVHSHHDLISHALIGHRTIQEDRLRSATGATQYL